MKYPESASIRIKAARGAMSQFSPADVYWRLTATPASRPADRHEKHRE